MEGGEGDVENLTVSEFIIPGTIINIFQKVYLSKEEDLKDRKASRILIEEGKSRPRPLGNLL